MKRRKKMEILDGNSEKKKEKKSFFGRSLYSFMSKRDIFQYFPTPQRNAPH